MDLGNLHLTPERKRELEKLLDQAHKDYLENLDNLTDAATDDMETVLARDPLNAQELVEQYARDASQLANDYYDTSRELWMEYGNAQFPDFDHTDLIDPDRALWQQQGGFADTDFNGLTYTQAKTGKNRAGKTIRDLWPGFSNLDDAQQFIADMITTSARLTTQRNIRIDPSKPRWARVPRGATTCAFCTMLASRGFAYLSEDTAGRQMQYHKDCDCAVVPSWGKHALEGYDPDEYLRMYDKANEATDGNDYREILKTMRRQNPDSLKDGVTPSPTTPWEVSSRLLSMRNEARGTRKLWADRQKALGVPFAADTLEYHEIVFLERFKEYGNSFTWIPKDIENRTPTNDFYWFEQQAPTELKSMSKAKYRNIADRISSAVDSAAKQNVEKSTFIIDLGDVVPGEKLLGQLAEYNIRKHGSAIKRLFLMDGNGLEEIVLK